jgi:DNA-binding response OmpR family regulator
MRILLIEDDQMLGKAVYTGLKRDDAVDWVRTAEDADLAVRAFQFDVVIADIGLPGASGLTFVKSLRQRGDKTPVLFLTARDTPRDRILGLDSGGDDYLVKPFDFGELQARIRALLRRSHGRGTPLLTAGAVTLDPAGRTVSINDTPLSVSAREFEILKLLLEHKNQIVNRTEIESKLYDMRQAAESNTVEVHISSLRRKLGKQFIRTIRGLGYIIDVTNTGNASTGPQNAQRKNDSDQTLLS